jgi:CRP/FNR family transcriptional regulator
MENKFASDKIADNMSCHHGNRGSCSTCRLAELCIPIALKIEDINKLESIVNRGRPIQKGDHIYREDEPFKFIYAVRMGSVKTYLVTNDGREQVTGFYMAGEVFGMDGVATGFHETSAIALDTSAICAIPFERLEELGSLIPSLQRHMFKLLGQEIAEDQKLITLLSKNSADERIAALFLSLSQRCRTIGLSADNIILPMSRSDIANYLGLTVETVSRVLSRMQKNGVIQIDNKELHILDMDALRSITNSSDC